MRTHCRQTSSLTRRHGGLGRGKDRTWSQGSGMCFYHVSKYHPYGYIGMKGPHVRCFGSQKDLVNSYDHSCKILWGPPFGCRRIVTLMSLYYSLKSVSSRFAVRKPPCTKKRVCMRYHPTLNIFSMIVRVVYEISSTSCAPMGGFSRGVRLNP